LIHGGVVNSESWQPYLAAFAEHYRVITPDSRGHGRTVNPSGTMSYRLLADDMAAFVQALDLHKPLIFGYSDGGQIALEIGMRYPDVAQALVVGAAWFKFTDSYRAWVRDLLGVEQAPDVDTELFERKHPDFAG
jgi:pimeloyl-ACP methyl ester carboxylesterase